LNIGDTLDISGNAFTGLIGLRGSIQKLRASNNKLSFITFSGTLLRLKSLDISNNNLKGLFPVNLFSSQFPKLNYLDISYNEYTTGMGDSEDYDRYRSII
jgi:Leucine-rich repeat (LRR) protein